MTCNHHAWLWQGTRRICQDCGRDVDLDMELDRTDPQDQAALIDFRKEGDNYDR